VAVFHSLSCFQVRSAALSFRPRLKYCTRIRRLHVYIATTLSANDHPLLYQILSLRNLTAVKIPITARVYYNLFNSETSSGRAMELHTKVRESLIEWEQFMHTATWVCFLQRNGGMNFSTSPYNTT
jgi:hypothetical protein